MAVSDYDTTPGNNTTISGINIAEGCSPGGINDAIRQMMADIASWDADIPKLDEAETISGAWTFSGALTVADTTVDGRMTFSGDELRPIQLRGRSSDNKAEIRWLTFDGTGTWGALRFSPDDEIFEVFVDAVVNARFDPAGATVPATTTVITAEKGDGRYTNISSGAGAPSSTPGKIGDKYFDTTNNVEYTAYGTTDSGDWVAAPLSKSFLSTGQTISTGSLLTLAHGLGEAPKLISFYIKCTTADMGYSVGDEVIVDMVDTGTAGQTGANGVYFDATNVYVRFSDTREFLIGNKSTGSADTIDPNDWDLYVRAFA